MIHEMHEPIMHTINVIDSIHALDVTHNLVQNSLVVAEEAVSQYQKVDKTGVIGFFADIIEKAIDFGHVSLQSAGVKYTYGFSICIFTLLSMFAQFISSLISNSPLYYLVKLLTLPLTTQQLESTTKMQKLTPLQQKITAKYADDETTKNQLLAQLFQTANVNPLAGCFPALVQLPIFLSLYRALTNLVAENKLDEPFLWIPDLEVLYSLSIDLN
jgi:YidC/Oxa1 family membrane protein insertase